MMIRYSTYSILIVLMTVVISGCFRGQPSQQPPIHIVQDMDEQPKYKPQSEGVFFEDSSAMRMPVPGTVAQGWLRDDIGFFTGMDSQTGKPLEKSPVEITLTGLQRGQERYNIYCSACHSRIGDGRGIMVQRGYVPPPTFHDDLVRNYADGHIFEVISNGIRNMPGYAQQIGVEDRWLIVNYLRALQRSQNASVEDVPVELRERLN